MASLPDNCDLDRITPLPEWFRRVALPYRSGMRLLASGKGPRVTQITERRRGIRERDHIAWLNARDINNNAKNPPPGEGTAS